MPGIKNRRYKKKIITPMGSRFAIIDPQKVRLKVKSQQTKLGSQKTKIDFIDTHQKNYIYDV